MTQEPQNSANLNGGDGSHLADQTTSRNVLRGGRSVSRSHVNDHGHAPRRRCLYCDQPFVVYRNSAQKYCSQDCFRRSNMRWQATVDHSLQHEARVMRDAKTAPRAPIRPVEIRRVKADDGKRYYARDADALLEEISDAEQARPGLWYA